MPNPMTPEQNTTNEAKVVVPMKDERRSDIEFCGRWMTPSNHEQVVRHDSMIRLVEKYIAALSHVESQLAEMTKANEGMQEERDALKEWRDCVSGAIKQIPEFAAGSWYGDKEGWGFHFEMVNHIRRERDALKSELAAAKEHSHKDWPKL